MRHRDRRVVLDGEESVRDSDEYLVRHAHQLAHETPLLVEAADVLQHRVRHGETERPVGEGQRAVRRDSDILDAREGAAEVLPFPEARGDYGLLVRVAPLEHVRGAGHHVRNADVQDPVARRRRAALQECLVDLVARGYGDPVAQTARWRRLVKFFVVILLIRHTSPPLYML